MAREDAPIVAARMEELRFLKRQQWTVTAAVVALITGAYNVVKPLTHYEKSIATILITIGVIAAIYWLHDLQRSLRNTRLVVDRYDRGARRRGLEVVYGMAGAMIINAIAVCYLFWRDLILGV
jgi:hypothetical protein